MKLSAPEPPSSSVTVTTIACAPPVEYAWLPVQVPLPAPPPIVPVVVVPSPQSIEQVSESFVPASVHVADSETGEPSV